MAFTFSRESLPSYSSLSLISWISLSMLSSFLLTCKASVGFPFSRCFLMSHSDGVMVIPVVPIVTLSPSNVMRNTMGLLPSLFTKFPRM